MHNTSGAFGPLLLWGSVALPAFSQLCPSISRWIVNKHHKYYPSRAITACEVVLNKRGEQAAKDGKCGLHMTTSRCHYKASPLFMHSWNGARSLYAGL